MCCRPRDHASSKTRWARRACLSAAIILGGVGLVLTASLAVQSARYRAHRFIHKQPGMEKPLDVDDKTKVDMDADDPSIAFQLTIENMPIDYPVVQERQNDPEGFYLTHDAWGQRSILGSLFLDRACTSDSTNQIIYGHRLAGTDLMFSALSRTWNQDRFDLVGQMTIQCTSDGSSRSLHPLCAMKVDRSFDGIRGSSFRNDEDFRAWLIGLCGSSSARAENWDELIDLACRACTTVTCTGPVGGRLRTIVIWVERN